MDKKTDLNAYLISSIYPEKSCDMKNKNPDKVQIKKESRVNESDELSSNFDRCEMSPETVQIPTIKDEISIEDTVVNTTPSITGKNSKKDFKTLSQRSDELISEWTMSFVCGICAETSTNLTTFTAHFHENHPKKQLTVKCCEQRIRGKKDMVSHIKYHKDGEAFQCPTCEKFFVSDCILSRHMKSIHAKDSRKFKCSICGMFLQALRPYEEHMASHSGLHIYKCPTCEHSTSYRDRMRSHIKAKHPLIWLDRESHPNFNASLVAPQKIPSKNLKRTSKRQLSNEQLNIAQWNANMECGICQEALANFSLLETHFKKVHPKQQTHILCCGLKLKQPSAVVAHARNVHLQSDQKDADRYECSYCSKIFDQYQSMKVHLQKKHPQPYVEISKKQKFLEAMRVSTNIEAAYRYECSYCSKTFNRYNSMYAHLHSKHPQEYAKIRTKTKFLEPMRISSTDVASNKDAYIAKWIPSLKCGICSEPCSKFSALTNHFLDHHPNQKPYTFCCDYRFAHRWYLFEHAKFHENPHLYACQECGNNFSSRQLLRMHLSSVHFMKLEVNTETSQIP